MIGDGSALKEKETPIARQHENIQTNGLLECNLDEVLVDLWDFDSWDAPTPETNVANSQISNSTKEDLRDVSTTGFANPNLNLIFVFMRTHYMSIMYEEFCAALLIRLRGQKGGGEGRTTSENSK